MATHGPIPNANSKVPKPTTPQRDQPTITTDTSIVPQTVARGRLLKITNLVTLFALVKETSYKGYYFYFFI